VKIWIDLSNSPHPLLFAPVARALEQRGAIVLVTARDNAQTVALARGYWPDIFVIGGASPAGRAAKASMLARRVRDLVSWARATRPDVALSHNSYAQIMAARALSIPTVTAMDFEHQPANHLAFRLANRILLPEAVRGTSVLRQGAPARKSVFYPGLKEELYLGDFEPNPRILDEVAPDREPDSAIVVARTPPTRALYHRVRNPLFAETLRALDATGAAHCVILTRHPEQLSELKTLGLRRSTIPATAVDARSLLYSADLVLGAGGTMTREAALLGVPTVSDFAGKPPAVDDWLEEHGLLRRLTDPFEITAVQRRPVDTDRLAALRERGARLIELFCDAVTVW
jgi:predicted glycosyltransferase